MPCHATSVQVARQRRVLAARRARKRRGKQDGGRERDMDGTHPRSPGPLGSSDHAQMGRGEGQTEAFAAAVAATASATSA